MKVRCLKSEKWRFPKVDGLGLKWTFGEKWTVLPKVNGYGLNWTVFRPILVSILKNMACKDSLSAVEVLLRVASRLSFCVQFFSCVSKLVLV